MRTDEFVALAQRHSAVPLDGLFRAWLDDPRLPPLPGPSTSRCRPAGSNMRWYPTYRAAVPVGYGRSVRPMTEQPDPVMERIGAAIALAQAGERSAAAARFTELWTQVGPDGDPLHRCTLAHHAADVQDDPAAELSWDLLALAAADELTDERARRHHESLSVAGLYPSLQLNVADAYRRVGEPVRAREHLALARERLHLLAEDGYGAMVRAGLDRLAARLDGPDRPLRE